MRQQRQCSSRHHNRGHQVNVKEILALPEMQSLWQRVQQQSKDSKTLGRDWQQVAHKVCCKLARRGKPWTAAQLYEQMMQMAQQEQQNRARAALMAMQ